MALKLVTCPETAHLEEIDYIDTPLGMLIEACSRFRPACAVTCERTCAARLDRRHRDHADIEKFDDAMTQLDVCGPIADPTIA